MKKKLIALLLGATMIMSVAGCGQSEPTKTPEASEPAAASSEEKSSSVVESAPEPKDPITLEWYFRGNGQQQDTDKIEEAVNELLKEYPGLEHVSININCFPGSEYAQQISLAQTSGAQMDIVNSVNIDFYQHVADGTWMPMDEYISDTLKEELPEWLWEMGSVDGTIYMVPNYQNAFNTGYMAFPKEYVDKYSNIDDIKAVLQDPSKTLKEKAACLEEYVMSVRAGEGNTKYATVLDSGNTAGTLGFYFTTPFDVLTGSFIVVDGTDKVIHAYEQDYYKDAWSIYADWYDKGIYSPDGEATDNSKYQHAKMMEPTSYAFSTKEMYGSEERVANTFSAMWGFDVYAVNVQDYNYIQKNWGAGGNGISSTSEYPEEAALFLEAITCGSEVGKKIYNTVVFGLEGEHWEWVDQANDRIKTLEYDGSQGGVDTSYAAMKWICGNSFYAYKNQAVLDDQYPVAKELNEDPATVSSSLIGFVPDISAIETELQQIKAVEAEYSTSLNRGTKGAAGVDAYYEEMMNKLKEAGLEKVREELQKQIDAFLAK